MSNGKKVESIWTPANVVTVVRICGVPIFVAAFLAPWPSWFPQVPELALAQPWVALALFIILAATDSVDGYLARSRNEVTTFGKFVDPLADKILVAAALLVLVELTVLPSWIALIILTREFIVSGLRMIAASQGEVVAASWYGKAKTVTQIIAITLFIVKEAVVPTTTPDSPLYLLAWAVMIIAVILTIVSMVDYFMKCRSFLGLGGSAGSSDGADDDLGTLAEQVVQAAADKSVSIGTAESLTGGMICSALVDVPGCSQVVRGGVASYALEVKNAVLGVDAGILQEKGAVEEEVAKQMAAGAAKALNAQVVVATTGIAGPGGEEPGKPVGTVWLGWSANGAQGAQLLHLSGSRQEVRVAASAKALQKMAELIAQQ